MSTATAAPSVARKGNTYQRYDPARIVARMTEQEYFAWEETQLERHDFRKGEVITVAGGSPEHNSITTDTIVALTLALRTAGNACEVYNSDQKVCLRDQLYCYPDITVVCGVAQFNANGVLLNPALIIEVLSPSTEREDRTDKFRDYQQIQSLSHYILIEQDRVSVMHYEKIVGGLWAIVGDYIRLDESLQLNLDGTVSTVPLTAIYRRVITADVDETATDEPESIEE